MAVRPLQTRDADVADFEAELEALVDGEVEGIDGEVGCEDLGHEDAEVADRHEGEVHGAEERDGEVHEAEGRDGELHEAGHDGKPMEVNLLNLKFVKVTMQVKLVVMVKVGVVGHSAQFAKFSCFEIRC
eukprot:symbB.v1.2.041479.t1/scaffold8258.1/size7065/2